MFQFTGFPPYDYRDCSFSSYGDWGLLSRVSPFRDPRIRAYLQLPVAFRSLSRLSSALSAKASTLRSCSLNHFLSHLAWCYLAGTWPSKNQDFLFLGCLVIFVFANFDTLRFISIRFSRYNAWWNGLLCGKLAFLSSETFHHIACLHAIERH